MTGCGWWHGFPGASICLTSEEGIGYEQRDEELWVWLWCGS